MRRVFPLRQAENCGYGGPEYSLRKLPDKSDEANRINKVQVDAFVGKPSDDGEKLVKKLTNSCNSSVASGDENLPAANLINNAAVQPFSNQKPPRASVYPIFTVGASQCYTSRRTGVLLDEARPSLERQRPASFSSQISSDSQAKLAKETKNQNQCERPLSNPKNRPFTDAYLRQSNLRTQSLRLTQLPDSVAILDGGDEDTLHTASDRRVVVAPFHTRSFSQAASDKSVSELSDFSSIFTKATESSSSRTLTVSESSSSKNSEGGGKPGRGSSPFKHLSARMVAEKLVKVLGKEKLRPHLKKPISSQVPQDRSVDITDVMAREQAISAEPTGQNMYATGSSMPADCQANRSSAMSTDGEHHVYSYSCGGKNTINAIQNTAWSTDGGYEHGVYNNNSYGGENTTNLSVAENDTEPNSARLRKLEGRARVKEDLVHKLDKEAYILERKPVSGNLAHYPTESAVQDYKDLRNEIRKLRMEKKELALEVASEIRARITDQKVAADQLRRLKSEMEAKVSGVEKDKQILQENLEREIDRRGAEWNAKLERMKLEEREMRERVKQMVQDQAELQKIIAACKEREACWMAEAKDAECSISNLKQKLKANETEMGRQILASAETVKKLKAVEGELESSSQRNAGLEMQKSEMQKELTRLRRVYNEQEMTIEGLWQELDEVVNGSTFECRSESLLRLQRELLRLAGVEQRLRNEINATQAELIRLKQDRDAAFFGMPADAVKLNQELQDKLDKLQARAALLQEENQKLSSSLRVAVRARRDAEKALKMSQFEEANCASENLIRAAERAGDGGNTLISRKERDEVGKSFSPRALSSKLQSREAELEQLDKEIIDIINARDALQMEVDDLHGKLRTANQQICELERQVTSKEEMVEVLWADGEKHKKELAKLQAELLRIRQQRDEMQKEAEDMSKEALKLNRELIEVRKTAEKLEDEVMFKEGQISILRGTYTNSDY